MKLKTGTGIILLMASVASAQTVVTSGTFGFSRAESPAGYRISGMQFNNSPSNTPETVYGDALPLGSKIYVWNGSGYGITEYNSFFVPPPEGPAFVDKWDADLELGSGEGYWVETSGLTTVTLSGDVPMDDAVTNSISIGLQICSYPYPVDRIITNLGFTPTLGDKIYAWNGSGYEIAEYNLFFVPPPEGPAFVDKWDNEMLTIAIGEGFWYESGANVDWIVERPY